MPRMRFSIRFLADFCQDLIDTRLQIVFRLFGKSLFFSISIGELFSLAHIFQYRAFFINWGLWNLSMLSKQNRNSEQRKENCKPACELAQGRKLGSCHFLKVHSQIPRLICHNRLSSPFWVQSTSILSVPMPVPHPLSPDPLPSVLSKFLYHL